MLRNCTFQTIGTLVRNELRGIRYCEHYGLNWYEFLRAGERVAAAVLSFREIYVFHLTTAGVQPTVVFTFAQRRGESPPAIDSSE